MTRDFVDDLQEAMEKERIPYILVIGSRGGKCANVRSNLDEWKPAGNWSLRDDIHQLLDVTVFDNGNYGNQRIE